MIDGIFKAIQTIVQFIEGLWVFLTQLFEDVVNLVTLLKEWLVALPDLLGFFPSSIITLLLMGFGVVVLYKTLGREG